MKILFDHQAFVMQTHGGVTRCFAELYKHLPSKCRARFSVLESDNAYLSEMGIGHPVGYSYQHFIMPFHWPYKGKMFTAYNRLIGRGRDYHRDYKLYNKAESIRLLKKGNYDVFHPTFFDDYFLPYLNRKPFVLTIHDMIPELFPQYFHRDDFQIEKKKILAPLASAVIVVSENTKRDVIKILNVPEEKVHVIYHGCSFPKTSKSIPLFDKPYLLYVGDRYGYKNFELFAKHIEPVLKRHQELLVVCTGKSFTGEESKNLEHLNLKGRFIHHWISNNNDFYSLYHNAVCFVYPSAYEGFGIPILEAYQADCPVLLNRASCFPEIAGDAAVYFEITNNHSNLSEQFEKLYTMTKSERELLLERQRNRLKRYSWEKSSMKLAEVYRSVL